MITTNIHHRKGMLIILIPNTKLQLKKKIKIHFMQTVIHKIQQVHMVKETTT